MRRLDSFVTNDKKSRPKPIEAAPLPSPSKIKYLPYDEFPEKLANAIRQTPGYASRVHFVRERIISENPELTYEKLADVLGVPEGEALVILSDVFWNAIDEDIKAARERD